MQTLNKRLEKKARSLRRQAIGVSIDDTWTSLRSHLGDAVDNKDKGANEEWHAGCVREYAGIIYTLAVELHELTKIDFKKRVEPLRRDLLASKKRGYEV